MRRMTRRHCTQPGPNSRGASQESKEAEAAASASLPTDAAVQSAHKGPPVKRTDFGTAPGAWRSSSRRTTVRTT